MTKHPHCHICGRFKRRTGRMDDLAWMCPLLFWDDYMGAYEHA